MVPKEELMKENAAIMEDLTSRTRELLEKQRNVFEQALEVLLKEEVISGSIFRELLLASISRIA
jgi:ATP-dependent Zn protease